MSRAHRTLACALSCLWALALGGCASADETAGSAAPTAAARIRVGAVSGDPQGGPRMAGAHRVEEEAPRLEPARVARSVEKTTGADYDALAGLLGNGAPPPAADAPPPPPPARTAPRFAFEANAVVAEPEPEPEVAGGRHWERAEAKKGPSSGHRASPVAAAKAKVRSRETDKFAIAQEEPASGEDREEALVDEDADRDDGASANGAFAGDDLRDDTRRNGLRLDENKPRAPEAPRPSGAAQAAARQRAETFENQRRALEASARATGGGKRDVSRDGGREGEVRGKQSKKRLDGWAAGSKGGQGAQTLTWLDDAEGDGRFEAGFFDQSNFEAQVFEQEVVARPSSFLPRTCYVSNTYLGNRAGHLAALAALDAQLGPGDRPYARLGLPPQPFDGPESAGIALTAQLDRTWMEAPGRVFLQVGLRGSDRHGWRRPPIDLVLVLDPAVAAREDRLVALTTGLLRRLGPQDRLGVLVARPGSPEVLSAVDTVRVVRPRLSQVLGDAGAAQAAVRLVAERGDGAALGLGLAEAGSLLDAAAEGQARVPGTQVVLLAVDGGLERAEAARLAAHQLTLQGAVVSVAALDGAADWWPVADAGHGNLHRGPAVEHHLEAELDGLSRVVARLLRLDIRLAPGAHAVRVLGAEVLGAREVARVKAREEAVDARLAKTTGLKADRGDDGEGIQIVVPWFAGGDSHVVLVELWVDEPGPVAEVSLKYKDMVALNNGAARVGVALARAPRPASAAQAGVRRNVLGFRLAEALRAAGLAATQESALAARTLLRQALPREPADRAAVLAFLDLLERRPAALVAEALLVAADRRLGTPAAPDLRGGGAPPPARFDRGHAAPPARSGGRITF